MVGSPLSQKKNLKTQKYSSNELDIMILMSSVHTLTLEIPTSNIVLVNFQRSNVENNRHVIFALQKQESPNAGRSEEMNCKKFYSYWSQLSMTMFFDAALGHFSSLFRITSKLPLVPGHELVAAIEEKLYYWTDHSFLELERLNPDQLMQLTSTTNVQRQQSFSLPKKKTTRLHQECPPPSPSS